MSIFIKKIFQRFKNFHSFLILVPIITTFLVLGFNNISHPGFYYDEVLFANALFGCRSFGVFDTLFIRNASNCFPILLMPYMGALKVYLIYPIKWIISFSNIYLLVRGFGLIISSVSIYLLYKLGSALNLTKGVSILMVTSLAFNMSFLFGSKYDWGPITLSVLLKVISLLLLIKLYKNNTYKNWGLFILSGVFGTFNKIDFVFYFAPLLFVSLTFIYSKLVLQQIHRLKSKKVFLSGLGFLIPLVYTFYFIANRILSLEGFHFLGVNPKIKIFLEVILGTSVLNLFEQNTSLPWYLIVPLMVLLIVPFLLLFKKCFYTEVEKVLVWSTLVYCFIIFVLPFSGGQHHFISIFPLPFILIAFVLNKVKSTRAGLFLYTLFTFYLLFSISLYSTYQNAIKYYNGTSWSMGSEVLYKYLITNHSDKRVLITDWGIANQQILLSKGNMQIEEVFRPIRNMGTLEGILKIKSYNKENSVAVKKYGTTFEDSVDNFDFDYYLYSQTIEYKGEPVYEVYYND